MKVKELIELLQKGDREAEIKMDGDTRYIITDVIVDSKGVVVIQ